MIAGDDPDRMRAIRDEIARVRLLIGETGGTLHSTAGDGCLATYPTVGAALRAAAEVQSSRPEALLTFRVGIHVGDVFGEGEGVIGDALNVAARLEAHAPEGGLCVSRAVRDVAPQPFRKALISAGVVSLKNMEDPVEIFIMSPQSQAHEPARALASYARPTVLVRPATLTGADQLGVVLARGFTIDLISRLSRFRHLDVIGRASSLVTPGALSASAAAAQVNARYVVEVNVLVVRRRLRLAVELIDGATEVVLWSEVFDRRVEDVFAIQSEVAEAAVVAMAINIETHERMRARARPPRDLDAYTLCIEARQLELEDGSEGRQATAQAIDLFGAARARDPQYAACVAGLARARSVRWRFGWCEDREEEMEQASALAFEAVRIDAAEPSAYSEMGFVALYRREHDRSLAAYQQALALNPSDVDIIAFYADALKHSGKPAESIPLFERALRLNPLRPDIYVGNMAHALFLLQDFEGAIALIRRMRQPLTAQRVLTASLMMAGRDDEGRVEAQRLRARLPDFSAEAWCAIVPDRLPEHSALLKEGLQRAGF
jgi:TolB-like protein